MFNIISSLFHVSHFMFFKRRLENVDMTLLEEKLSYINRYDNIKIALRDPRISGLILKAKVVST